MKTKFIPLAGVLAATLLSCANQAEEPWELQILHTNDVHARFLQVNRFGGRCSAQQAVDGECLGGAARRASAIAAARASAADDGIPSILVDAGDQFQGTLFYSRFRGSAAARVMNALNYDAMVVGNHEFDDGPPVLADFAGSIEFPLLATNLDATAEPELADRLQSTSIIERDGRRIGLVGFITEETPDLSSPGPNLRFLPIEDELRSAISQLEREGVDLIVALSHAGFGRDLEVARTVAGIDVIVGGHTNTLLGSEEGAQGPYPTMIEGPNGDQVAVVTAYAWGQYLGNLRVVVEDGRVIATDSRLTLLDASIPEDAELVELVAPLAEEVDIFSSEVVGQTEVALIGREAVCRFAECNLGNLITDALLEYGRGRGVEIALQNGGGIRSSLDAGDITIGEFLEVMPFGNTASFFRLTGSDLLATLEHAVSRAENPDNDGTGRFLQVSGLRYVFDPSRPVGERISDVRFVPANGEPGPIDPDREYSLLFNAFNRNGGDGFSVLAERAIDPYDQGRVVSDIVMDYLRNNSPVRPETDGRIQQR